MSGGVDSSLAAALLQKAGHDVVGVTLHLWDYPDDGSVKSRCCAPEDIHDARRVCDVLGVPHFAFDRRELFAKEVVEPFVDAYLDGVTPSPCVRCNRGVKIKELLAIADRLGATRIATGHYARLSNKDGNPQLLRACDLEKDQSYFLHMLSPATLSRLCFPLGELSKAEVRAQAQALGLPGASKGESQELCFIPTGRYDAFIEERAKDRVRPGNILNESGQIIATHEGIHRFTIGQRKNLGVATGERAYVVGLDANASTVKLGARDGLQHDVAELGDFVVAADVVLPIPCGVAVRYRGKPHPARVSSLGNQRARVQFEAPVQAIVPGQYAVLYDGDRVLGGGIILRASTKELPVLNASHTSTTPSPAANR
jgi:tRNA-uridine 2-sulfurtransferase